MHRRNAGHAATNQIPVSVYRWPALAIHLAKLRQPAFALLDEKPAPEEHEIDALKVRYRIIETIEHLT